MNHGPERAAFVGETLRAEISDLTEDIASTSSYAGYLASEVNLYHRLLSPLGPDVRRVLLEEAYAEFYPLEKELGGRSYSLPQFVAYYHAEAMYNEKERLRRLEVGDAEDPTGDIFLRWQGPASVNLSKLSQKRRAAVSSILAGSDAYGLGGILAVTVHIAASPDEGVCALKRAILRALRRPNEAALLIGGVDYNLSDVRRTEGLTEVHVADMEGLLTRHGHRLWSVNGFTWSLREFFDDDLGSLKEMASQLGLAREQVLNYQQRVFSADSWRSEFGFEETPAGLLIPIRSNIAVAKSLEEAVLRAERDREAILSMSPRRFEEFVAFLFKELGFVVELTKCTRDGGADLLCLRSLHGVPFRLAVELKRYRDSPVSVALVRSFVGANKVFQANKLLYVTTSRYTAPAVQYADQYVAHLLTLKGYEQIQEWCREVRSSSVRK